MVNMTLIKRFFLLACAGILIFYCCTGCKRAAKDPDKKTSDIKYQSNLSLKELLSEIEGEALVCMQEKDPGEEINPITAADSSSYIMFRLMYLPLFTDSGKTMVLADHLQKSNGSDYIISLKKNIVWSDGKKFTADDVIFTYQLIQNTPDAWAHSHLNFFNEKVVFRKIDEFTVKFIFPSDYSDGVPMLSDIPILPEHIFYPYNDTYSIHNSVFWRKPVGTGPFIVRSYSAGEYYLFEKNKNYTDKSVDLDYLIFAFTRNTRQNVSAIIEETVDCTIIPSWDRRILNKKKSKNKSSEKLYEQLVCTEKIRFLGINGNRVRDKRLREAIFYCLDRELINESGFIEQIYYKPEYSFFPQISPYYNSRLTALYSWNPDKAEELLEDFKLDQIVLTLAYLSSDDSYCAQAVLIKDMLSMKNINIALQPVKRYEDLYKYDLFLDDMPYAGTPDIYRKYFSGEYKTNVFGYFNPSMDSLWESGYKATSFVEKKEIYDSIQKEIVESAYFYPLSSYFSLIIYKPRAQDFIDMLFSLKILSGLEPQK